MNLYQILTRKRRTPKPARSLDPSMTFTIREWADLPTRHPRTERD